MSNCNNIIIITRKTFFVDINTHESSLAVLKTRASFLSIEIVIGNYMDYQFTSDVCGAIVQYPNSVGTVEDYTEFIRRANEYKVKLLCNVK